MINRLKTQLSNSPISIAFLLAVPLIGFFIYARFTLSVFYYFLAGALGLSLADMVRCYLKLNQAGVRLNLAQEDCEEKFNLTKADLARQQQVNHSLKQKISNYQLLKNLTERLSDSFSLMEAARTLASDINSIFSRPSMTVIIYCWVDNSSELSLLASWRGGASVGLKAKRGDLYDLEVVKSLKPLLVEDTKNDFRFSFDHEDAEEARMIKSLISVPMSIGEKSVGILRVDSQESGKFNTEDLRFLNTVASLGAVAMDNAQLYERVENLAIRDGLTGLFLRRYFVDRLTYEIERHNQAGDSLSLIMIDLDRFKKYNDRFGHTAGDFVLQGISQILTDIFNFPGQIVCRYGGEEFCVLLPDCSGIQARESAEEIRRRVEAHEFLLRRQKTKITVSIGFASYPKNCLTQEELIQQADQAMYQAKARGGNFVLGAGEA